MRQQAERLRWIRERTAQVRSEVPAAFADARTALLAFCASDPSSLTWDSLQELHHRAMWPLEEKLSCLESLKRQTADLPREVGGVIELFPGRRGQ